MSIDQLAQDLKSKNIAYKMNEPLAHYTTIKIGGPADIFVQANTRDELVESVRAAAKNEVPYTILGWGSNSLISDKGLRGLVVRNLTRSIDIQEEGHHEQIHDSIEKAFVEARLTEVDTEGYYTFDDLNFDESESPKVTVNIESGAFLPYLIMKLIQNGVTGLQWFGGIPGTLGGAIYNNIHGGTHFISEYVKEVEVYDPQSDRTYWLTNEECEFAYDYSRFHKTKEIILSANMKLFKGDTERAKAAYIEWTRRKKLQPQISAGCVWQNISEEERKKHGFESTGWGYIIDKVLGLKGKRIGNAQISTKHAAFIENLGGATAADAKALMDLITKTAEERLKITPKPEIFLLGEF